jgi:hypothetical protein
LGLSLVEAAMLGFSDPIELHRDAGASIGVSFRRCFTAAAPNEGTAGEQAGKSTRFAEHASGESGMRQIAI